MVIVAGMYLRDLLIQKGVHSPADFGRRMDISRQHAWLLWNGKTFPSLETIQRLIEVFSLDPADLARLEREPERKQAPRRKPRSQPKKRRRPRRKEDRLDG